MMNFAWTDDAVAQLRAWWAEGKSCSAIVTAFAMRYPEAPPSRNAVIGKAHRLKLDSRASPIRPNVERQMALKLELEPRAEKAGPCLADMTPGMCHWPFGHPNRPATFFYCASPVARPGSSYCAEHMARAYRPVGARDTAAKIIAEALGEIEDKSRPMTKAQRLARAEHAQRIYGRGRSA